MHRFTMAAVRIESVFMLLGIGISGKYCRPLRNACRLGLPGSQPKILK